MYEFATCLKRGEAGERFLDEFFAGEFAISPATRKQQREGIDRIFTKRKTGSVFRVEYKTDYQAHRTGNAFLETVSVDVEGKKGWVYTSRADYLIYFVAEDSLIYVVPFKTLRKLFPGWLKKYQQKEVANASYTSKGICVPLTEFERCAEAVISA